MRIIANEFVLPLKAGRSCHASSFLVLPDGKIFVVYFCGSGEGKDDVRIFGSMRSPSVAGQWSEPVPISPDDGIPHWNPVLMQREDGSVVLFYKVGKQIASWKTYVQISTDGCLTWSDPREMIPGDESGGRGPVRNKTLTLSNGTILAPGSTEWDAWRCFFDLSDDGGKTWRRSVDLCIADESNRRGIIQPTLWEDQNGVHALMRSTEGFVYRTDSADFGTSWSAPYKTDLPNNNSGIDLDRTADGRLILAYNPVSQNWGARTPLSLAVSADNGETWEHLTHLVTMTQPNGYSYPAIRCADGMIHVTYTWNRETIGYMCLADE